LKTTHHTQSTTSHPALYAYKQIFNNYRFLMP